MTRPKAISYRLLAEREGDSQLFCSGAMVPYSAHGTVNPDDVLAVLAEKVEEAEYLGEWPEGYDAIAVIGARRWMLAAEWDELP